MFRSLLTVLLFSAGAVGSALAADSRGVDVIPVLQAGRGQARALLIGVNDYERLKDLNFCEADVSALRDRLVEIGFDRSAVKCLTTGDPDPALRPSFRNISERLDALFAGLDADSVLVIALSGHGGSFEWKDAAGKLQKASFFCPQDARLTDPLGTMISLPGIYERLDSTKCPARFKLLVTDACRDPHFVPDDVQLADKGIDEAKSMAGFADSAKSLSDARRLPKGTLWLVSCSSGEQSWEDRSLGHGIFMHYVLEALAGSTAKRFWKSSRTLRRWRCGGLVRYRLEPRESRRQLEQQREELPVGEPQQEYAGEPEQQPRVPRGLQLAGQRTHPPNRTKSRPRTWPRLSETRHPVSERRGHVAGANPCGTGGAGSPQRRTSRPCLLPCDPLPARTDNVNTEWRCVLNHWADRPQFSCAGTPAVRTR